MVASQAISARVGPAPRLVGCEPPPLLHPAKQSAYLIPPVMQVGWLPQQLARPFIYYYFFPILFSKYNTQNFGPSITKILLGGASILADNYLQGVWMVRCPIGAAQPVAPQAIAIGGLGLATLVWHGHQISWTKLRASSHEIPSPKSPLCKSLEVIQYKFSCCQRAWKLGLTTSHMLPSTKVPSMT